MPEHVEGNMVLLLDDLPFKRTVISKYLSNWAEDAGLAIMASCVDDMLSNQRPSGFKLVILSIGGASMADPDVVAAYRIVSMIEPDRPIVVLGDRPDTENVERAIEAGLSGYISTSLDTDIAVAALNFVLAGGSYFPADALREMGSRPSGPPPKTPPQLPDPSRFDPSSRQPGQIQKQINPKDLPRSEIKQVAAPTTPPAPSPKCTRDLTARQRQVLVCLTRAKSNKEIARELDMSEATVKVHVRQVMKKLGALNRTHAAILATRVAPDPVATERKVAPISLFRPQLQHATAS